jgi:putative PEP-CTERM system TPR-repeat lipoprotein
MRTIALLLAIASLFVSASCNRTPEAQVARLRKRAQDAMAKKDYGRAALALRSAIKIQPKNAEVRYELGLLYMEVGDLNAAATRFQEALQIKPTYTEPQLKMAQLMTLSPDMVIVHEAERRAQSALAAAQGNSDAIATLALVEMRLGETQTAEERLRGILLKFPKHLNSSLLLATIKIQNRDFPGAEAVLKTALQQDPKSTEAMSALAQVYIIMDRLPEAMAELTQVLSIDPKNAAVRLNLAQLQLKQGKTSDAEASYKLLAASGVPGYAGSYGLFLYSQNRRDDAIKELVRVYKAQPEDRDSRSRLVAAYLAMKRTPDAEKVLSDVLEKNPKDTDALLQRAQIYLIASKYGPAENDLNRVFTFRPDWADAHYVLARVYQAQGATQNQRRELTEAVRIDPSLLPARIDLAQALIAVKDAKAALDLMNQAPENQRNTQAAIVQRNWALLALSRLDEMQAGVQQGLGISKLPELQLQDALVKLRKNDTPGARAELKDVLSRNPEELRALELLARSYAETKEPGVATSTIREYADKNPKSAPLQQFLGSWLLAAGDRAEARKAFETAKQDDPTSVPADFALAEIDLIDHNLGGARDRLLKLLSQNQTNVDARVLLGMVEEASGRFDSAIDAYRKVVDIEATNLYALNNLAYRLTASGKNPDEALKYAQRAFELSPNSGVVEDTLGWALYSKGIYEMALPHLRNAVNKEAVPVRMYHLASAYLKTGDEAKGRETYRKAVTADPNLPEAKAVQDLLQSSGSANRAR